MIYLILFLVTLPAFFFLLKPGEYWNMHDDMQLIRQLEMEKCFQDGQFPCRWSPDLGYGYGYPLFNFYPPLPYYVGQVFRLSGQSFVTTVKLTAIAQIILSSLVMFVLITAIFGSTAGLIASVFYTYAPYHLVNIYVRGAMNEAWAGVFFPLIFLFIHRLVTSPKLSNSLLLALSFSLLLQSHNPMALIFLPPAFAWFLLCLFLSHSRPKNDLRNTVFHFLFALVFSLSLSAYFTLPVIIESSLVQIESMFQNYYHFTVHFVSIYQLFFSSFWGDGPSVWGPNDGMSFSLGYLHWILPIIILLLSVYVLLKKKRYQKQFVIFTFFLVMGAVSTFLTHQRSVFIWQLITPLQKIQFPWRFLSLSAFFLSLSTGYLSVLLKQNSLLNKYRLFIVALILVILIFISLPHLTPVTHGPITDRQKFSGIAWTNQITSGIYDYLPKTASKAASSPPSGLVENIDPGQQNYLVENITRGTDWISFNIYLPQSGRVTLAQLYFPGFKAYVNGKPEKIQSEPLLGRMVLDLPGGSNQVFIRLFNTPIRTISNLISLISWTALIIYFLFRLWMRLYHRN